MPDYDVIVIGAGCGGITVAALLARQGRKVLLLEQSSRVGGCCSTYESGGYRFDIGATILEIIDPIEAAFRALGTTLSAEVELEPCDPVYNVVFEDGTHLTYPSSVEEKAEVIAGISPEDGRRWLDYSSYFSEFLRTALKGFFVSPANGMADMVRMLAKDPRLAKFFPLFTRNFEEVVRRYFKNDRVQQSIYYPGFFSGLPPALAPGIFGFLAYSEHEGVWYPRGGMIAIPEALRRCGERYGLEVRLNQRVEKVLVRDRRVEGVVLADGSEITSRAVVSNINAKTLYLEKIGEEHLPWLARIGVKSYRLSASAPMISVGIDYMLVTPMDKLNGYWFNEMERGLLPEGQFGLICFPTLSDPSLAPEGHHVLNIILAGPYHLKELDWDRDKQAYGERQLERLSERAVPGLADHVQVMEVATPRDYERKLLMPEGAFLGLDMDLTASTVFRPAARSRSIKGLYLAGGSTHPGGGVPTVISSGIIAAELVDRYEKD
jgi:phytoene desaturase